MSVSIRSMLSIAAAAVFLLMTGQARAGDPPAFACDLSDFGIPLVESQEVTIRMTSSERELLNLAIPGYIADVQGEEVGATDGGFVGRAFGLHVFSSTTVPCIREMINAGPFDADGSSVITFNSFERVAIQIMTSIWNPRNGVMSHHIAGCLKSRELRSDSAILCQTFFPLARAAKSLFEKISRDQPVRGRDHDEDDD